MFSFPQHASHTFATYGRREIINWMYSSHSYISSYSPRHVIHTLETPFGSFCQRRWLGDGERLCSSTSTWLPFKSILQRAAITGNKHLSAKRHVGRCCKRIFRSAAHISTNVSLNCFAVCCSPHRTASNTKLGWVRWMSWQRNKWHWINQIICCRTGRKLKRHGGLVLIKTTDDAWTTLTSSFFISAGNICRPRTTWAKIFHSANQHF